MSSQRVVSFTVKVLGPKSSLKKKISFRDHKYKLRRVRVRYRLGRCIMKTEILYRVWVCEERLRFEVGVRFEGGADGTLCRSGIGQ